MTCSCLLKGYSILFLTKIRADNGGRDSIDVIAALALISHESFERRKDDGEMRIVQAGHLVTQRFTPTRTLNCQHSPALNKLFDNLTLPWMKARGYVKTLCE